MSKKQKVSPIINLCLIAVLAIGGTSVYLTSPNASAADTPIDVEIIEVADDGSGSYKPWEDITDAMPGETYSLIPRVINYGEEDATIYACLEESGQDSSGNPISIPSDTFLINVNSHWLPDGEANCYKYDSVLSTNSTTEPLFEEVTINSELGNEYQNATFNLHITVEGIADEPDNPDNPNTPDEPEEPSITTPSSTPDSPDTGFYTFISSALPTISIAAVLIAVTILLHNKRKTN